MRYLIRKLELLSNILSMIVVFNSYLLKRMLVASHKMAFIENEAVLPCVTMRERAREFTATI